jgi:hypothetical protein
MKYLTVLFTFLFLIACANPPSEDTSLTGKWKGVGWMVNGQDSGRDADAVVFEFQPQQAYSATFGAQTEAGKYRKENNKLYTTADGQAEKMVEITFRGKDTLLMDMNRAGTPETLILVKE